MAINCINSTALARDGALQIVNEQKFVVTNGRSVGKQPNGMELLQVVDMFY